MPPASDRGQSTVEFALVLPLLVVTLVGLVHMGVLARDQVLVAHAAREGVRAAAVDPDPDAAVRAVRASGPLSPSRLEVETRNRGGPGSRVTVAVSYLAVNPIPLLRNVVHDRKLTAQATMRVER